MRRADAIVVGGGVVGSSVAFHLVKAGLRVVVLERVDVAAGATGSTVGFVRSYHAQPALTRLALSSRRDLERWPQTVGGSIGFVRTGCLYRLPDGQASPEAMSDAGGERCWAVVGTDELHRRMPWFRWPRRSTYVYEREAGYASGWACADAYLRRVSEDGGSVRTRALVTDVRTKGDKVTGVLTSAGSVSAPVVVLATGPWALKSGLPHPGGIFETKRIVVQRVRVDRAVGRLPAYIDEHPRSFYFRPKGTRELFVGGGEGLWGDDPDARPSRLDPRPLRPLLRRAEKMIGTKAGLLSVVTGVDAYTPDGMPVIDRYGPDGLYVATGFSGSGFKVAPAVGRLLGAWIAGGGRDPLLRPFGLERFAMPDDPALANSGHDRRTLDGEGLGQGVEGRR